MDPLTRLLCARISAARQDARLSQEALAEAMKFNDRQTISAIELGLRRVSPEELIEIASLVGKPVDYFTDPYLVTEKSAFSYRTVQPTNGDLAQFEDQAHRLISAQRRFRELLGETPSPIQPQLSSLSKSTPLHFATFQGEQTAAAWKLGEIPALTLRETAEKQLKITVLYVDAPDCVSGAACRLPDGSMILINRKESLGRQSFDLGHEIFHLLTWERMPPEKIDPSDQPKSKVEQLADAYTAGLLMPGDLIRKRWDGRGQMSPQDWIREHARDLQVSTDALYFRLVGLRLIDQDEVSRDSAKPFASRDTKGAKLYSKSFVQLLHRVLSRGHVTVLKATELLDCSIEDLESLFKSYDLASPFAL